MKLKKVSFKTALAIKDSDMNIHKCKYYYTKNGYLIHQSKKLSNKGLTPAPTLEKIRMLFRVKKNVNISIIYNSKGFKYRVGWCHDAEDKKGVYWNSINAFNNYEDCLDAAIYELLTI